MTSPAKTKKLVRSSCLTTLAARQNESAGEDTEICFWEDSDLHAGRKCRRKNGFSHVKV